MTRKETTGTTPQEVKRVTYKWTERDGKVLASKRIEVEDVFIGEPLPDTDDRDIGARLRAQLPYVPRGSAAFGAVDAQAGGIWAPFVVGVSAGALLTACVRVVAWVAA